MDYFTDEINIEEPTVAPERPGCSRYILALVAFLTLLAFGAGLFRNFWNDSTVRFVRIRDQINKSSINPVDVLASPSRSKNPIGNFDYLKEKVAPFNIPIETGECTLIRIVADGYFTWERLFCPSSKQIIEIEIELVPEVIPPGTPDMFET